MSYNISKELFEAVMNIVIKPEQHYICPVNNEETIKVWSSGYDYTIKTISYNDFFFKCKEFVYKNEYRLLNGSHDYNNTTICCIYKDFDYIGDFCELIKADSEQQAVFDACQWILDNKGNK